MKIGILTFHHVDNYGALLQTYALWTLLNNQNHDVEIIDYRPYKAVRYYLRGLNPFSNSFKFNSHALPKISKAWKMRRFLVSNIKLSKHKCYSSTGLNVFRKKYDVVICGSDQVWCINAIRGFDLSYFLDFVCNETTRKISYAASFGNTDTLGVYRDEVSRLISEFDTILVRDENSSKIVFNECESQAIKVLDPTFLVEYTNVTCPPKIKEKYLLIYGEGELTLEERKFITSIAEARDLKIVSVGKYNEIAHYNLVDANPKEWLGLFRNASHVVTNTYHGTIFSIIFRRIFTVFFSQGKFNKTNDLLSDLQLGHRVLKNPERVEAVNEHLSQIDYDAVYKILALKVLSSRNYLLEALKKE